MRMLSIRIRPDAYAQYAHQFLTRMLSMVCRDLYNERPLEKWKTDAHAEHKHPDTYAQHAHQFLARMLSISIMAGAYS
jgi:hypothetical protein